MRRRQKREEVKEVKRTKNQVNRLCLFVLSVYTKTRLALTAAAAQLPCVECTSGLVHEELKTRSMSLHTLTVDILDTTTVPPTEGDGDGDGDAAEGEEKRDETEDPGALTKSVIFTK